MPRGRAGLSAIHQRAAATKKLQSLATTYEANSITHAQNAIKTLQESITTFASSHKEDIATDPAFRAQFLQMCGPLGVDPLSSESGFWGKTLGIGDFYYELAVKASEICVAYKSRNGGVMALSELRAILEARENKKVRSQKKKIKISEGDVETAIQKLEVLGTSFKVVNINNKKMVLSVPLELDGDHIKILQLAEDPSNGLPYGVISTPLIISATGWTPDRAERGVNLLVKEGMAWVDIYKGATQYYLPSLCL